MRRILITGASGALGNLLADNLGDNGFFVTRVSRTRRFHDWWTNDMLFTTNNLSQIDTVIHCAFPREFTAEVLDQGKTFFQNLLQACINNGVNNFINISSQDVYGNFREIPSQENSQVNPENAYAHSKLACENIGLNFTQNSEMNYTNIRLASLIGPMYNERIINKMAWFALTTNQINVQHSRNVFSFMNIQDAVEGLTAFVRNSNPQDWQEVYNLGVRPNTEENTLFIARKIHALCTELGRAIGEINVQSDDANISRLMNSERFYNAANWESRISLQESIEEIFQDVAANSRGIK